MTSEGLKRCPFCKGKIEKTFDGVIWGFSCLSCEAIVYWELADEYASLKQFNRRPDDRQEGFDAGFQRGLRENNDAIQ